MNQKAFFKVSYGLYIVSSVSKESKYNGQIANTVFQVTSESPKMSVCINKNNLTHKYIEESGVFSISVLRKNTPMSFIGKFGFKSGKDIDKFENVDYVKGARELPIVRENSVAYFECEVVGKVDIGTHTLFIGKVLNSDVFLDEEVMTYDYYHKVKKGKSPESAPTFVKEPIPHFPEKTKKGGRMDKYRCTVCGYVYEPEKGDPDNGIEPGTKFEDIPDDWVCPVCGVGKGKFEKV